MGRMLQTYGNCGKNIYMLGDLNEDLMKPNGLCPRWFGELEFSQRLPLYSTRRKRLVIKGYKLSYTTGLFYACPCMQ